VFVQSDFIRIEREGGVVTATIDDLENKNAVNDQMNQDFVRLARWMEEEPDNRVLILTGSQHIFCSGGNIRQMTAKGRALEAPPGSSREQLFAHEEGIRLAVLALRRTSKPVIAAVNGHAVGSGIGLAAGCDIRLASNRAQFGWVFVRRGIVADDASLALMIQLIGYANAFEWGITGRTIDAERAREIGFVQQVVPHDELLPTATAFAREIVDNAPPITAELFKLVASAQMEDRLNDQVGLTQRAQALSHMTDDHAEALLAYKEKREPIWKGQ
jgi:enoyl-CoA hydratase/carnithine racemase